MIIAQAPQPELGPDQGFVRSLEYIGGEGIDTIYFNTDADFSINLAGDFDLVTPFGSYSSLLKVDGIEGYNNAPYNVYEIEEIYTGSGVNALLGTDKDEIFHTGEGDDLLTGGAGNDILDGGLGLDIVDYSREGGSLALNIDLNLSTATDSFGFVDTLISIEGAFGGAGNDTLIGNAEDNILAGNQGDDLIDGGAGFDLVNYYFDKGVNGINVQLNDSLATDTHNDTDTLSNIEGIIGSRFDDLIVGNNEDNTFVGMEGEDILDGFGGNNTVNYLLEYQTKELSIVGGYEYIFDFAVVFPYSLLYVDLAAGYANDLFGDLDTLHNIQNVIGSDGSDTIFGDAEDNILTGNRAEDLEFVNGNPQIIGATKVAGVDLLVGHAGNDTLSGSLTDLGLTIVDYSLENGGMGVQVNLALNQAVDTHGDMDTLIDIEKVIGTNQDDILIGDANANLFVSNGGSDTVDGGVAFSGSVLDNNMATAGAVLRVQNLDQVIGSAFDDVIIILDPDSLGTGEVLSGVVDAGDGNDTLSFEELAVGVVASISSVGASTTNTILAANQTVFIGGDAGEGLDLDGNFTYAIDMGGSGGQLVNQNGTDLVFDGWLDPIVGVSINGAEGDFYPIGYNLGGSANDLALADVMDGEVYNFSNPLDIDLAVEAGSLYRLQLISGDDTFGPYSWDINIEGEVYHFDIPANGLSEGQVFTIDFLSNDSNLDVILQNPINGPVLLGLTLEELPILITSAAQTTFTGGDLGEGLDLDGNFAYAIDLGGAGGQVINQNGTNLVFDGWLDPISGASISGFEGNFYPVGMDVGNSANDIALTDVLNGEVYNFSNPAFIDLAVDTGTLYRLQLISGDDYYGPYSWDINIEGTVYQFDIPANGPNEGQVFTIDFINNDDELNIVLENPVNGPALFGLTLEVLDSLGSSIINPYANFENLTGSNFDDTLSGNSGANVLVGLQGNDILSGLGGQDTFTFNVRDGQDVIDDFEDGIDLIDLRDFAIDFAALDPHISQNGDDVVIDLSSFAGETQLVTLAGVDESLIDQSDFLFA